MTILGALKHLFDSSRHPFVIAIDGPAASGKGTIARRLAETLHFDRLDTGALYRAVAWAVLSAGGDPMKVADAVKAAHELRPGAIDETCLRSDTIGDAASKVAAIPEVRAALLDFQRNFAKKPPGGRGAVIDGRDIGTVIVPHADVKIFVTARDEVRARRRYEELRAERPHLRESDVLADLKARDRRDSERAVAPMTAAPDAHLLETSELDIDTAVTAALKIVESVLAKRLDH
jgi:cytidylate kinase